MNWFQSMFKNKSRDNTVLKFNLIADSHNKFYSWNGKLYQSDVVRSCIRPKAKAIGKLIAKHIRDGAEGFKVNPDPYMRFLLEEPNPYMTGQMLQEKLATQLALNNNAFAVIYRDEYGYPIELYPVPAINAEAIRGEDGQLSLKFMLKNGKQLTVSYSDVIHLRQDYNDNDIFGDSPAEAIESLMEIITTTDQGIVNAVKNSAVIKWILKFKSVLQPKDRDLQVKEFVNNYLSISNDGGAAASDPRYDLEQVKPENYIPNAEQMKETLQRIYSFFNTNEKIVQSKYTEDEWVSYAESEIEPLALQMSNEFSVKLFSRRERAHGNRIVFDTISLTHAAMKTKLQLVQFVDRGMMTPNEVRRILNMSPIEGGDEVIRRLDTRPVEEDSVRKEVKEHEE